MSQRGPPELLAIADYLRKSVSCMDAIAIERRVEVFQGKAAIAALMDTAAQKTRKHVPEVASVEQAKAIMKRLIATGCIVRAHLIGSKEVPLTAMQQAVNNAEALSGSKESELIQPTKIHIVEPDPLIAWSDDALYIWIYEGSKVLTHAFSFGLLAATFLFVMFPIWPAPLRSCSWYLAMGGMGMIGLMCAVAVLRLVLFVLTRPFSHGLWLFPNLFEDVGVLESFVPLYAWQSEAAAGPPVATSPSS